MLPDLNTGRYSKVALKTEAKIQLITKINQETY